MANAMTPVTVCNIVSPTSALHILLRLEWVDMPNRKASGATALNPSAKYSTYPAPVQVEQNDLLSLSQPSLAWEGNGRHL
jgi:hypothetical protein